MCIAIILMHASLLFFAICGVGGPAYDLRCFLAFDAIIYIHTIYTYIHIVYTYIHIIYIHIIYIYTYV